VQIPPFPTTTIGSFPQTAAIRKARADLKAGRVSPEEHERAMDCFISEVIGVQEGVGLDVLVHGEPERSDMCAAASHLPFAARYARSAPHDHCKCSNLRDHRSLLQPKCLGWLSLEVLCVALC
jgi:Cobalamin-independent synthase, Catalytic domain